MRYFVQQNADGSFSVVQDDGAGNYQQVGGPYGNQQEAEQAYNSLTGGAAMRPAAPTAGGGGDSAAIATFLSLAGNDPTQQDLVSRLRNGAYSAADMQEVNRQLALAGGGGGGGAGGTAILPAQIAYQVQQYIAELQDATQRAELALSARKFEEYDLAMLRLQQAESELNRNLQVAGVTGYYESQPTFQREQWQETTRQQQEALALERMQTPGDWITYLAYRRGGLTPEMAPPTSRAILAGQPLPGLQGITPAPRVPGELTYAPAATGQVSQPGGVAGETETPMAGIEPWWNQPGRSEALVEPTMRVPSTQAWYQMTPAEQQSHQAIVGLYGVPWSEYETEMQRLAPGEPYPLTAWR